MYTIVLKLSQDEQRRLNVALWHIPVKCLISDPNDEIYTRSYTIVPEGKTGI
jgi:hypothetical protein